MRSLPMWITSGVAATATAAALLALPSVASADLSEAHVAMAPSVPDSLARAGRPHRYDTAIRFLDFDHVRGYGSDVNVRGQVRAKIGTRVGALQGVRVTLLRRLDGSSRWYRLDTDYTSQRHHPKFEFAVRAKANAHYKVVYDGNRHFQRSSNATTVTVYRLIDATLDDGSGRFHGRVHPAYSHHRVALQRRACPSCGWHRVDSDRTTARSRFSFTVGAPRHGRTWWRASVRASTAYLHSYSAVFTTERR